MTYAQPQTTYAQPQMIEQVMQQPPMTTSVIQAEPVIYGTQQMQMEQIIMEPAPAVYIQAPQPQVEVREVVREMIVPQIQTVEKIIEVPQIQTVEEVVPVPQISVQMVTRE